MADWRKIWGEISDSERFHAVDERTRLAYLQAYPKTDREGRLPWSAKKLRALAFPLTEWSTTDVQEIRSELVHVGLWIHCSDSSGQEFIHVWRFEETQGEPKRRSREQPSKFGDPINLPECVPSASLADTEGIPNGHPEEIRKEERRGEKGSRAHAKSEDCAVNGKSTGTVCLSSSHRNEATYQRISVLAAVAKALDRPEFVPSTIDERSLPKFAGLIKACPDLDAFCSWGIPVLREKKPVREHWLADLLPLLNDYKPGRVAKTSSGLEPATGPPEWWAKAAREAGLK